MPTRLMKQEPGEWGWNDLVAEGESTWDGVRNHQAAANIRRMKKGDKAFFYHSVDEKQIVGIMKVTREAYPDPTAEPDSTWVVVDVKPVSPSNARSRSRRSGRTAASTILPSCASPASRSCP